MVIKTNSLSFASGNISAMMVNTVRGRSVIIVVCIGAISKELFFSTTSLVSGFEFTECCIANHSATIDSSVIYGYIHVRCEGTFGTPF